jgi:hypothetical protein
MQPRDFCDLLDPAVSDPRRLPTRDPTTLLLIQSAEQHIELSMVFPIGMVANSTPRATTLVNYNFR